MKERLLPDARQTWLLNKDSQEFGVFRALLSHNYRLTPSTSGSHKCSTLLDVCSVVLPTNFTLRVHHYQSFLRHNFVQVDGQESLKLLHKILGKTCPYGTGGSNKSSNKTWRTSMPLPPLLGQWNPCPLQALWQWNHSTCFFVNTVCTAPVSACRLSALAGRGLAATGGRPTLSSANQQPRQTVVCGEMGLGKMAPRFTLANPSSCKDERRARDKLHALGRGAEPSGVARSLSLRQRCARRETKPSKA
jgi:hypothetical protein